MTEQTLEEVYGITKKDVQLKRVKTKSGKYLEWFKNPSSNRTKWTNVEGRVTLDRIGRPLELDKALRIEIQFPEFTCLCPRTGHPDFATITLRYIPNERCVELKSWKYFLNSFRDEGHFHEQVTELIYQDLVKAIKPCKLQIVGRFNRRGGTEPVITRGEWLDIRQEAELLEP